MRAVGVDANPDPRRLCILGRVRERFRDNVIGGHFGRFGQPLVGAEVKRHRNGRSARQCLQRWAQSAFGKNCRMNPAGYLLEILRCTPQARDDVRKLLPQ